MKKQDKPVRLFVDCHVLDGKFQGTRTYIEELYKELIKEKNIHFFFAAEDIANLESTFGKQENITFLAYKSKSKTARLLIDTPRLIRKHEIDFAHFQYRVPPIKCCKYIVTVHDVLFEDFPQYFSRLNRLFNYYTYKFSARYSEIVLTVSHYSKNKIKEHLGVADAKVIPNGVAQKYFEIYDKAAVKQKAGEKFGVNKYIIYISRKEPRKNHSLLLTVFNELELYRDYHLVFIGGTTIPDKHYRTYYEGLENIVKEKILDFESLDMQDTLLLLRGADASVYPSLAEGFGIPPLEALAAGIPVLSSNATAMADFDFMGEYLFDPLDKEMLKAKLLTVLSDENPARFKQIQQDIKERYSWKNSATLFLQVLNDYIKKHY